MTARCPAWHASAWSERAHPEFDGITFHEVLCKSALNKVPDAAHLPFGLTVNGYRGLLARLPLLFRAAHP